MSTQPIQLGPFELHAPFGRGGMAEVWQGVHVEQAVPVAVKVVTVAQAREQKYRDAFRNEVQAVAALDHPGIVLVLDYGTVTVQAEQRSEGRLVAGCPYLVMELASRGALDRWVSTHLAWPAIRTILLSLLDALAHAHAHGVVHRDIKPANVLLSGAESSRPGLKLTDFGIAHAHERRGSSGLTQSLSGTPAYMAPEQIHARSRDFGPWTDLYAVGCLAYELLTGRPPFEGNTLLATALAHLTSPAPAVVPRVAVPSGVDGWVARLLQKDAGDRFQRCADAAWALLCLDPTPPESDPAAALVGPRVSLDAQLPTLLGGPAGLVEGGLGLAATTAVHSDADVTLFDSSAPEVSGDAPMPATDLQDLCARTLPPVAETWRRPAGEGASMRLVGAGLGLYGLRTIPLVDRDRERDVLWSALADVRRSGSARAVVIGGAAGVGKSRLVGWICERAHELGAATVLKANHGQETAGELGLAGLVARHLRCHGLDREQTTARVRDLLLRQGVTDEYEWLALTELMAPVLGEGDGGQRIRFSRPVERWVLVGRLIERLGRERPVIVWLDDVQWSADSLGFAAHLLTSQATQPLPALVVMTAREDAQADADDAARLLETIAAHEGTRRLTVPPLPDEHHAELVRGLLGLEGALASDVEQRTGGNPLFAVQLIGDWVQRGVLRVGPRGFALAPGERAVLPDDIHGVWRARLDRALRGHPADSEQAIELAAVLGRHVRALEWHEACHEAGLHPQDRLLDALVESRLIEREEDGWSFAHAMLRESLERSARDAGRWAALHRACAHMLSRRYTHGTRGVAERLGRHMVEAGEHEEALGPLLDGAREHRASGDYRASLALLDLRDRALEAISATPADRRLADGLAVRATVFHDRGRIDDAARCADVAISRADQYGWVGVKSWAIRTLANVASVRGELDRARARYSEAQDLAVEEGDTRGVAWCLMGLANVSQRTGDHDRASELYSQALHVFEDLSDATGMAKCLCGMSLLARQGNVLDLSDRLTERARELFERVGNQSGVAECWNGLAEASRFRGDLAAATEGYRRALRLMEAIGSGTDVFVRINLGLVLLLQGRWAEAGASLEAARADLEAQGLLGLLGCVHAELLPSAAAARDWDAWDRHLGRAVELLARAPMVDPDIAWPAQLGGDLARDAGDPERARAAYELALTQWRALGSEARLRQVQQAIADL